jgi:chromosome segregation ATPase
LAQLQEEQQQQLAASQAAWADCPSVEDVAATIDAKLSESSSQVPSEMAEQLRATEEQLAASVASLAAMSDRLDASEAGVDVRVARLETAVKQAQAQTTMASEAVQPVAAELGDEQEGSPTLQTALRQMLDHTDANARAACSQVRLPP